MRQFVVFLAFLVSFTGAAPADSLYVKYKLYAVGLPIGSGVLNLGLSKDSYTLSGSGETSAFGRLVSDGKGTVKVKGGIGDGRFTPESYNFKMTSSEDSGKISMKMNGGKIDEVSVKPPQDRMKQRVKVTPDHLTDVLDPLSAAVIPAPKGLNPESCNRTLQLFDGKERYNVHLSYKKRDTAKTADGRFNGKVLVCGARYEPVAGHRRNRKSIEELAANKSLELWLAPVGKSGYLFPLKASIKVPFGALVVEAEKFKFSK